MASSPLRAPAAAVAGQQQSRLLDMQKKFQQKHLAAVKGVAVGSTSTSTNLTTTTATNVVRDPPVAPVRRLGGIGVGGQQQRRSTGPGSGTGSAAPGDGDSVVQVDVKGKVRQLFAERNQQQHVQGPGYQHHQQQRRQRRRSLTGRDRSRPLRPLSGADDDPLCKTVCFTAPSLLGGADLVGINGGDGGDVRTELLALFGRLPNLGGRLWSESFRGGGKMKTAQSAPELKWLLDGGPGVGGRGAAVGGVGGGGPGPPVAGYRGGTRAEVGGDEGAGRADDDDDRQRQHQQRTAGQTNSKTATIAKKPLAAVNGVGPTGRGARRPADGGTVNANRLLLPPVVQPTVINALAAGASAAVAVASVGAAAAAGAQRPVARASKLPPATPGPPKPAAPSRRRVTATPPPPTSKPAPGPRRPAVVRRAAPAAADARPQQPVKQQLSADRGPPAPGMARCPLCSRDFAADRLPKHEEVCRRSREKDRKRKVFDTSRKRLEAVAAEAGVDVASFKKKSQKEDQRAAEKLQRKKDAWRRKHDQLVRNVRNARAVQRHLAAGGTVRDLPPELENASAEQDDPVDSDLVKCPHCGRTFNEASAERHIPLCADRQRNAAARTQNRKR